MAKDKIKKNFWTGDYFTEHYDNSGNYIGKSVPKYDSFREKSYIEHYNKDGVVQQHSVLEKSLFSNKPKWNTYEGGFLNAETGLFIIGILLLALFTLIYIGLSWGTLICMILGYNADKNNKKSTYYIIVGFVVLFATAYLSSVDILKENEYLFKFTGVGLIFGILSTFICLFVILIRNFYKKSYSLFILIILESALICIYAFSIFLIDDKKVLPVDLVIKSGKDFEVVKNKIAEETYEDKKKSYKVEFDNFRKFKPLFNLIDYKKYESEINGYTLNYKDANFGLSEIEKGKEFIMVEFGDMVRENTYALEKRGYNGPHLEKICESSSLNGFDFNYQFRSKDHINDIKTQCIYYEYAIENGEETFVRIFVEVILIEDNIDEYIKYKEAKSDLRSNVIKVYLHDEYLNNKNIPITLDNLFLKSNK